MGCVYVCVSQGVTPAELDKRYCAPTFHANKPSAITQCVAGCWIIYLVLHRFHELAKNRQALKIGVGRNTWDWELSAETHAQLRNKIIILNNSFIFLKCMIEWGQTAYRFLSLGNFSSLYNMRHIKDLALWMCFERRGKCCLITLWTECALEIQYVCLRTVYSIWHKAELDMFRIVM